MDGSSLTTHGTAYRRCALEALADGCIDAAIAIIMEKRRPDEQQSADSITRQKSKVDSAVLAMSHELGNRNGAVVTPIASRILPWAVRLATSIVACQKWNWREMYPNLAKLSDKLARR